MDPHSPAPAHLPTGTPLRLHRPGGLSLTLSSLGAAWLSCEVPLADGTRRAVILPRSTVHETGPQRSFIGATIGRYANRIGHARIAFGQEVWALTADPGSPHQLHGGPDGFDRRVWQVLQADDTAVRLALHSPDGDQGFPGAVNAEVIYRLADAMTIEMEAIATTTAPTPVCLTNHAYFNLDGRPGDVREHRLRLRAGRYLPVDTGLIPLGDLAEVQGTGFDFRTATPLGARWLADAQQRIVGGYDHAYRLDDACVELRAPAAELTSTDGRLGLALSTSLPAIQLYTGQFLDHHVSPSGRPYPACGGVALEPQFLPDSPNHPEWPQPSCWVLPGEVYRHRVRYRFTHSA